jgi:polyhydroxyalkanoate synthesis repressor PhaR
MAVVRLIKRYGSRKLYDTEESRYVSLEEIGAWVREGQEIRVVDNDTSEDVTASTLAQVILEDTRRGSSPPNELLHELIRRGGELMSTGVEQLQQGVDRLLEVSVERLPPLKKIRNETAVLRQRLEELEATLARFEAAGSSGRESTESKNPVSTGEEHKESQP